MRLSNYKKIRKLHCAIKQYTKVKVRMTSCLLMPREVTPIQSSGGGGGSAFCDRVYPYFSYNYSVNFNYRNNSLCVCVWGGVLLLKLEIRNPSTIWFKDDRGLKPLFPKF